MITLCTVCGTDHHGSRYALVRRWFKDWSGTWSNAVVCDGKSVDGYALRNGGKS